MSAAPTVFLVDDDPSVLKSLERLVRAMGYRAQPFGSAREFLESFPNADMPGCLILDVQLPELSGLELQQALTARNFSLPVVFLTGCGDIPMSVRAIKAGAVDFLTKPWQEDALLSAIEQALAKDREARDQRAELDALHERLATLTPREKEVLALVAAGQLNKQIAAALGTCEQTVKVHRGRVMEKLRVKTLPDLVRLAEKAGISVSPQPGNWTKV